MSRHDSHSRFDMEPSPKRYRRDEKQDRHKQGVLENGDRMNRDLTNQHKHDERGSAGQVGRNSGQRKAGERGWWKDSRNQQYERADTSHGREQRDEKSQAKLDDNTFQRRFSERKDDPPTARKRPAFRQKKILVDVGDANSAATVAVKSSQIDRPPERNERREERSSNPHHLHRVEKQFADDRAPNMGEARRDGFPFRVRYGGSSGNSNYRGRDKFNGNMICIKRLIRIPFHRMRMTRLQSWKHSWLHNSKQQPVFSKLKVYMFISVCFQLLNQFLMISSYH